jgi:hypothetical protein
VTDNTTLLASLMKGTDVARPLDDSQLVHEAAKHGATPLIARHLRRAGATDAFANALLDEARSMTVLDTIRERELELLLPRFAAADVPLLVIKGAALARTHYAHSSLRPRCDTDVLIERESAGRAARVLRDAGYGEEPGSGGEVISRQRMWVRLDNLGIRHCIDLHWALSNRQRYAHALTFAHLWSRAVPLRDDARVRMPSRCDALLLAAIHLTAHHSGDHRLIWLYDIHLLHGSLSPDELEATALLARERNVDMAFDAAIALALYYFGDGRYEPFPLLMPPSELGTLVDDLRFTRGVRPKLRLIREHLFPPASYVLQKYSVKSRSALPALYVRRAIAASARMLRGRRR